MPGQYLVHPYPHACPLCHLVQQAPSLCMLSCLASGVPLARGGGCAGGAKAVRSLGGSPWPVTEGKYPQCGWSPREDLHCPSGSSVGWEPLLLMAAKFSKTYPWLASILLFCILTSLLVHLKTPPKTTCLLEPLKVACSFIFFYKWLKKYLSTALGLYCGMWAFSSRREWASLVVSVHGHLFVMASVVGVPALNSAALGLSSASLVVVAHGLSCSIRDRTHVPNTGRRSLNYWMAREATDGMFLNLKIMRPAGLGCKS